jgi:hypothetical protein
LESIGLHGLIKADPEAFEAVFLSSPCTLTAQAIVDIYNEPCLASEGSNARAAQVRAIWMWRNLVFDIEGEHWFDSS